MQDLLAALVQLLAPFPEARNSVARALAGDRLLPKSHENSVEVTSVVQVPPFTGGRGARVNLAKSGPNWSVTVTVAAHFAPGDDPPHTHPWAIPGSGSAGQNCYGGTKVPHQLEAQAQGLLPFAFASGLWRLSVTSA